MAIKVKIGGVEVQAENEEDLLLALRVEQRMRESASAAPSPSTVEKTARGSAGTAPKSATADPWSMLMDELNEPRRRTLAYVKAHDGCTLDELSAAVGGGKNSAVAGYLTGIKRNATKVGIKVPTLLRREEEGHGKARIIRYSAGPLLRANEVPDV